MDRLSYLLDGEGNLTDDFPIDYGRCNEAGVLGLYAFFYGGPDFTQREKQLVKPIRITDEKLSHCDVFLNGDLNSRISSFMREVLRKQVKKDLRVFFENSGYAGFAPLLVYALDMSYGVAHEDFAEVLRECSFDIPEAFKSEEAGVLSCQESGAKICLQSHDQLMAVTDTKGELTAYLANCQLSGLAHAILRTPHYSYLLPVKATNVCSASLDQLREAWNAYVKSL